jgi:uncharacterized protein (DUF58 family)
MTDPAVTHWAGPGTRRASRPPFTWARLLWSLVYPQRGHRILPTIPGVVLIGLAMGIGTAAYNSSSNILFITLSLLLACLILSGVLSWLNLRGVSWRLRLAPPLRAGHDAVVALELRNAKAFLPTYGLWFDFAARTQDAVKVLRAESTLTGRDLNVRAILAKVDAEVQDARLPLPGRLDPRGETRVEWVFRPERRGIVRVELAAIGSLFPFGFLRKDVGTDLATAAIVWPAPIEYRRHPVGSRRRTGGGERIPRAGVGGDLLALRRYAAGDSHRLIHWKASARTGQLLVRQFAAEGSEGYSLWLRTDAGIWTRPEQFEVLVSFAATLAEDLFRAGRLVGVALNGEAVAGVRRVHDLELFLNKLAVVRPTDATVPALAAAAPGAAESSADALIVHKQHVMTFAPEGARGVAAYVDGQKAAST